MKNILDGREMKQCDKQTIEKKHMPSAVLMERAALAVVEILEEKGLLDKSFGVICGMGNNGGDGYAIARLLHLKGVKVKTLFVGSLEKQTEDCKLQKQICEAYDVVCVEKKEELADCEVLLDALFGIGLTRDLTDVFYDVIAYCNQLNCIRVAVDIPSGVSSENGNLLGIAMQCDYTITFAYEKIGHLLYPGKLACGETIVKDIGIYGDWEKDTQIRRKAFTIEDLANLPRMASDANKGTQGKVLLIVGSDEMGGAAFLSSFAALTTGAGLVKVYTTTNNREIILSQLPEAIVVCYDRFDEKELLDLLAWADVVGIGPGLGQNSTAGKMVETALLQASTPIVLDADALNILAKKKHLLKRPHTECIVTPHLGEMARLTDNPILYIQDHKLSICEEFARDYQVICVLKDAASITAVPYEDTYINTSGCEGMATAGSGDVLTGMLCGLIAQGVRPSLAAPLGVYLHGLSGEYASHMHGKHSMRASAIVQGLEEIYKERGL